MTKAASETGDNGGRCELCNRDDGGTQSTVPVMLGGGLGQGTMWQCARCIEARKNGLDVEFEHPKPPPKTLKTWRDLLPAIRAIYAEHGAGCCWHVLLDDGNFTRGSIEFCAGEAERKRCRRCLALIPLARLASLTQLSKAARHKEGR